MADYEQNRMIAGSEMPYWLRDIYAYQQGGDAPRQAKEYFSKQEDMDRYDEMLARLLSEDEYRRAVAGWLSTEKTKVDPKMVLEQDPTYAAWWARGQNRVPSYVK